MSHTASSVHATLHWAPVAHASAQSLLSLHSSVHGDFVQVNRHRSAPSHVHLVPHSPLVVPTSASGAPPSCFGAGASLASTSKMGGRSATEPLPMLQS